MKGKVIDCYLYFLPFIWFILFKSVFKSYYIIHSIFFEFYSNNCQNVSCFMYTKIIKNMMIYDPFDQNLVLYPKSYSGNLLSNFLNQNLV